MSENVWSSSSRFVALVIGTSAVVLGLLYFAAPDQELSEPMALNQINMPPFEMVRTVTYSSGEDAAFLLRWEGERAWKESVLPSNDAGPRYSQEISGTMRTRTDFGSARVEEAGPNVQIPGLWFSDLDWLMGRHPDAKITETATEVTVEWTNQLGTTVWVLHKETGIPLEFREISPDGVTTMESRAVSIVLLSGEVVR